MQHDYEILAEQVLKNGVSVINYEEVVFDPEKDRWQKKTEWLAIDEPVDSSLGHSGLCGVGPNPIAAINDMLKQKELNESLMVRNRQ